MPCSRVAPPEIEAFSVAEFVKSNAGSSISPAKDSLLAGRGYTWVVVSAPHIEAGERILSTKFSPILYTLSEDGSTFASSVRYENAIFGKGWLSASGTCEADDEDPRTLVVDFNAFWWDRGGERSDLRPSLSREVANATDSLITALGRLGFVKGLSKFPVLAVAEDRAVFRFPPLSSDIAIRRLEGSGEIAGARGAILDRR